ncbi:hypothetical protein [Streptomyces humi]|uniref:hypothetical protein n=1 Tax=Streptomyces humi TaxID=1428620 RepID=UPI000628863A|nr:hypothetical protein [Streptomyces humi]
MVRSGRRPARTVRLAGRRPGTRQAPARRPTGLRQRWRHIDWSRAGTITAVVAALAGLLLTGVSTLYDALVSQGELGQARQAADQETRAQALRVSYWTEYPTPFVKRLHVINGSPDPVWEVDLLMSPAEAGRDHVLQLPTLAPCSETVMTQEAWGLTPGQGPPYAAGDRPPGVVRWMAFRDRDGVVWKRDGNGLSRLSDDWTVLSVGHGDHALAITAVTEGARGVLPVKQTPSCGNS